MKSRELERVLERTMAFPNIRTEPGFSARLLVPPGELYDPLFIRDYSDIVLINDDGGQEPEMGRQGRIVAIDGQGNVRELVGPDRLLGPPLGFDIAPASFAPYQGQIFTVSQPGPGAVGAAKAHIVQRIDLTTQLHAETVCTLPPAGQPLNWELKGWDATAADGKGIPSGGMAARFGPDGTPFAGKFFGVTWTNSTVYQVTSDGECTPFVSFDSVAWGKPVGLAFSPDGQHLLVSMYQSPLKKRTPGKATIARVRSDSTIEAEQLIRTSPDKPLSLWGMMYAPPGFGSYGGQLFVAANNEKYELQGKYRTHTVPEAGEVYRLTPEGELKLVATGFFIAADVHFVGNRLWVSDINGDFMTMAARELPDGFVVEILAT